TLIDLTELI
nr:Chain C, VP60-1 [Rabbit hemorrhagic disease virus]